MSRTQEKRRELTMLSRVDDSPRMDALPMFLHSFYTVFPIKYELLLFYGPKSNKMVINWIGCEAITQYVSIYFFRFGSSNGSLLVFMSLGMLALAKYFLMLHFFQKLFCPAGTSHIVPNEYGYDMPTS